MDMHPNIPPSQSPSAPPTERDEQRMSQLEDTVALLLAVFRKHEGKIKVLETMVDDLIADNRQLREQLAEQQGLSTASLSADKTRLEFHFDEEHLKKDIYAAILDLQKKGYITSNVSQIIRHLATTTNLGSESSIRSQFYAYK